jgi:UDP-2-acetamido-3-amino-2,3-dideoxy-glucuronate N-acetyltransferase
MNGHIADSADVHPGAIVGSGTSVWDLAQVREGAQVGARCMIGRGAYVDHDVVVGDDCKVQNHALVYHPAVLGDGVFIGPAAVLTNDRYPRAISPDGTLKGSEDWDPVGVTCLDGASIGARAVCVAPVRIGRWAMVAAGAVVIHDVMNFSLVVGSPARHVGWVGPAGVPLVPGDAAGTWCCPATGSTFRESDGLLTQESS